MTAYAELICRTHHSFLRGASHPADLVARAYELGLTALAITDRNGIYGLPTAYQASLSYSKKFSKPLKLITGAELTLEGGANIYLLAKNRPGYGLLCQLVTESHEGRVKGNAVLSWSRFLQMMDSPNREGLIAILHGQEKTEYVGFKEIFQNQLYIGLCRSVDGNEGQEVRAGRDREGQMSTQTAVKLSRSFEIPLVATNDVSFHSPHQKPLQKLIGAIRERTSCDPLDHRFFSEAERYLKSPDTMKALFNDLPEAIKNTVKIAEQCDFSLSQLRYFFPAQATPEEETPQSHLERLAWKGASERYFEGLSTEFKQEFSLRLKADLEWVQNSGLADYFLVLSEIADFARSRKILFQGRGRGKTRGSAANSVLSFCLGITALDPVRLGLDPSWSQPKVDVGLPDIHFDVEIERREELIQFIYNKYGPEKVSWVAAVIRYGMHAAASDIEKALVKKLPEENLSQWVQQLQGFPKSLSLQRGGLLISSFPISETVPTEASFLDGRVSIQWDKQDLDSMGLFQVDILGLGALSALKKAFELVQIRDPKLCLWTIPKQDEKTFEMIRKAETIGVFQLESRSQRAFLSEVPPRTFNDLVDLIFKVRAKATGRNEFDCASHAYLAYAFAYIKCHYPAEFSCALLNSQPIGFYAPSAIISEAKRHDISILPIDVNYSFWDCTLERGAIRLGWRMLPGVEKKEVETLIEERKQGDFRELSDFLNRSKLPRKVVSRLAVSGGFSCFSVTEREALWQILSERVLSRFSFSEENQLNLFLNLDFEENDLEFTVPLHPMANLRSVCLSHKKISLCPTDHLKRTPHNKIVSLAGLVMIDRSRPLEVGTISGNLEDEWGFADLTFHEKTYEKYQTLFENNPFVIVTGKVERDQERVNFIVGHVATLLEEED